MEEKMEEKFGFSVVDGVCSSIEENNFNTATSPQDLPPKKGNHSSLIDDLNMGELIDEIMEIKDGS